MHSWKGGGGLILTTMMTTATTMAVGIRPDWTRLDQRTGSEDGTGLDRTGLDRTGQDQIGGHGSAQGGVFLLIVSMTFLISS